MFAGRETESDFLKQYYEREGSQILVIYGVRGIGKTRILKEFVSDKPYSYYAARACSATEQLYEWSAELGEETDVNTSIPSYPGYLDIFNEIFSDSTDKKTLIIDEFQYLVKASDTFFTDLVSFIENRRISRPVFVVLISSATGWIENNMVRTIGPSATYIDGFLKVKELSFPHMRELFPEYSTEDALKNYMVLGGIPGLWQSFDNSMNFRDNVIRNILHKESRLFEEMSVYLNEDLREPAVYSTILVTIARGFNKLNDIYGITGFSRAKISVYLKNLMELDLIEKIYSGVYRIANPYVKFYFRFLFPNKSILEMLSPEEFYDTRIRDSFEKYANDDYCRICRQLFSDRIFDGTDISEWRDKDGVIDIVTVDDNSKRVVGKCIFYRRAEVSDYERLLAVAKRARIMADRAVLYAEQGFSGELEALSREGRVELNSICGNR